MCGNCGKELPSSQSLWNHKQRCRAAANAVVGDHTVKHETQYSDNVDVVSISCDLLKLLQDVEAFDNNEVLFDFAVNMIRQLNIPNALRLRLPILVTELLCNRY